MSKYISLTTEQREEARNTDLAEFLKEQGETITIESGDYVWRAGRSII